MTAYVDPDLLDDEGAVAEGTLAALADLIPGWEPSEGHLETAIAEAVSIGIATVAALVKDEARNDYAGFGERILNVPRTEATLAESTVTITVADLDGHTIPAGYQAVFLTPADEAVAVVTVIDAVVEAGATAVSGVPVVALDPGPGGNGASGSDVDRDPVALPGPPITGLQLDAPTSRGNDAEPLETYVEEVARRAQRRSLLPLTPANYADATLEVPGVFRAFVRNRVDPGQPGVDAVGHVEITPVDSAGNDSSPTVAGDIVAYFGAMDQLIAAEVHVVAATVVPVDVAVTARRATGVTEADAAGAITAAVSGLLSKTTWNADASAPGGWRRDNPAQVTVFDIAAVLDDLPELRQVTTVTLNGGTAAVAVAAHALADLGVLTVDASAT